MVMVMAPEDLPSELLAAVDIILPNEGELARLTGLPTRTADEVARAAMALRARGPRGEGVLTNRVGRSWPYARAGHAQWW